jgi:hypothetical protein
MATSFSAGRSRSTRRQPPTMGQQLVSVITCGCESSTHFFVIYKAGSEPTPYWCITFICSKKLHRLSRCAYQQNWQQLCQFSFQGTGGSMSQLVGLPSNSYKPITNTVWAIQSGNPLYNHIYMCVCVQIFHLWSLFLSEMKIDWFDDLLGLTPLSTLFQLHRKCH